MNTLDKLKELQAAETPGPWEVHRTDVGDEFVCMVPSRIDGPGATVVDDDGGMCPYNEEWEAKTLEANAELIVTMRNNAEALIEVAEAAKWVRETTNHAYVLNQAAVKGALKRLDAALAKLTEEV